MRLADVSANLPYWLTFTILARVGSMTWYALPLIASSVVLLVSTHLFSYLDSTPNVETDESNSILIQCLVRRRSFQRNSAAARMCRRFLRVTPAIFKDSFVTYTPELAHRCDDTQHAWVPKDSSQDVNRSARRQSVAKIGDMWPHLTLANCMPSARSSFMERNVNVHTVTSPDRASRRSTRIRRLWKIKVK